MQAHHAIVFEGERAEGVERARLFVAETIGIPYVGNPDVAIQEYDQYTIDDARFLKERAYQAPMGPAQAFVLAFDRVTHQAQNALLKLLEEPAAATHLILVVPTVEVFLPTVLSRLAYGGRVKGALPEAELAERFLAARPAERAKMVEVFHKNVKDDLKLTVRTRANRFLDALESSMHADPKTNAPALSEIMFVRQYIGSPSSSLKMLLEHLAFAIK